MKVTRYIIYFTAFLFLILSACAEDSRMPGNIIGAKAPEVKTEEHVEPHATDVTVYGQIVKENGAPITDKGFIWKNEDDGVSGRSIRADIIDGEEGKFSMTIKNLKDSTNYTVLAYAKNEVDSTFTSPLSFKTLSGRATVRTVQEPIEVRANRATLKGEILFQGEGVIEDKGFEYRLAASTFTAEMIHPSIELKDEGSNFFTFEITGLQPETEYFVRAYVRNSFGTSYGEEIKIKTTDGKPKIIDFTRVNLTEEYAEFSANVSDEGDDDVTERGFIYSTTKEGLSGTGTDSWKVVSGSGAGTFKEQLEELSQQQLYYIIAFARNEKYGISVSDTLSFTLLSNFPTVVTYDIEILESGTLGIGGEVIDAGNNATLNTSGIVYSTSSNPTLETGINRESGDTVFSFPIRGLKGETLYYVRSYAKNNKGLISYGEVKSIKTPSVYQSEARYQGPSFIEGSASYLSVNYKNGKKLGYLIGGNTGKSLNEFWEFDPSKPSWRTVSEAPFPVKRSWNASIYNGTVIFSFGGLDENGDAKNDLYRFNTDVNNPEWALITPNESPSPRYKMAYNTTGGAVYIIGGLNTEGKILDEVWTFVGIKTSWDKVASLPEPQYNGYAFNAGSAIYAGLGLTSTDDPAVYSNRFFMYDEKTNRWSELPSMPGGRALGGTVVESRTNSTTSEYYIYVADDQGTLHRFNVSENSWERALTPIPAENRKIHCMFGFPDNKNKVYIGLGNDGSKLISYDPGWDN